MSILFYKRPNYVEREKGFLSSSSCRKYAEKTAKTGGAIPPELSFDNVINNRTLPPCSLQDFLDYLIYVSHDAENLQFYLWLQDYQRRFEELPKKEQDLSPVWVDDIPPDVRASLALDKNRIESLLDLNKSSGDYNRDLDRVSRGIYPRPPPPPRKDRRNGFIYRTHTDLAINWEAFTIQPFRREISLIISHYILPGSPRELNLSHRDRNTLLRALHYTTHPSAFSAVRNVIDLNLRHHSHPNFVRWSICNGNRPRVFLLRTLAALWLALAAVTAALLVLSPASRWVRLVVALPLFIGLVSSIVSAKGLCVLLHRLHERELHPWELDGGAGAPPPDYDAGSVYGNGSVTTGGGGSYPDPAETMRKISAGTTGSAFTAVTANYYPSPYNNSNPLPLPGYAAFPPPSSAGATYGSVDTDVLLESHPPAPQRTLALRLAPLGPPNSFLHEPWVGAWRRRGWWRRLRVRKAWVREEALRVLQNRVVRQAEAWAAVATAVVVAGVCACPVVGVM